MYEVSAIALPEDSDDYATPDDWLADVADAALVVEVISQSEKSRDIRDKADWYAVARVPVLFVIDPRKGTWALHTHPDNGAYRDVLPGKFGESVLLTASREILSEEPYPFLISRVRVAPDEADHSDSWQPAVRAAFRWCAACRHLCLRCGSRERRLWFSRCGRRGPCGSAA
ncbi:Uma2 family endonuclease [Streptomyces sp. GQFP]|uniref:Uma2 family endonuclease n=1 Tax=Streptomyces sp. GQFP TaxID=2907545 RepID=UPI001F180098|nr:Uma2 family endonuclease [Streptomyces sp. GQFP]UIX32886.1 Uma2 family endonuclease [Streptomyces sp. GQFP]